MSSTRVPCTASSAAENVAGGALTRAQRTQLAAYVARHPIQAQHFITAARGRVAQPQEETMNTIQHIIAASFSLAAAVTGVLTGTLISAVFGNGPWAL